MKFEEWSGKMGFDGTARVTNIYDIGEMYADWKAEREDLLHANEVLGKENVRIISQREKLIGALEQLLIFEDDHDAAGTEWYDAQKLAVEQAHNILAEVKGER